MNFNSKLIDSLNEYTYGAQPQDSNIIKLNTNENPYPPAPEITDYLSNLDISKLAKYCDPTNQKLKNKMAEIYHVKSEEIFIGNGSDDVLFHLYRAFLDLNDSIIYPSISYGFYEVYADLYQLNSIKVPLNDDLSINLDDYNQPGKVVVIANPNAPTSLALPSLKIEKFIKNNPDKLIVIDEAYADFSTESCLPLIQIYDNLLIVQTLSKSSSLAGLRLGYCMGNANLIKTMDKVKNCLNPYNVDMIAQDIATLSFSNQEYKKATINKVITTRTTFIEALSTLGFTTLESHTNFVFTTHSTVSAFKIYEALLKEKIYVRHFETKEINNYLRISIGTDNDMDVLISKLEIIIKELTYEKC